MSNYPGMTNHELAQNLIDAERDGDINNIIYYENEIAARLNLNPNETEQGLSKEANEAITQFCFDNGAQ
jgi:hypothetical protein